MRACHGWLLGGILLGGMAGPAAAQYPYFPPRNFAPVAYVYPAPVASGYYQPIPWGVVPSQQMAAPNIAMPPRPPVMPIQQVRATVSPALPSVVPDAIPATAEEAPAPAAKAAPAPADQDGKSEGKEAPPCTQAHLCDEGKCKSAGFWATVGVYVLRPHWETNPAFTSTRTDPTSGITGVVQADFGFNQEIIPMLRAGYTLEDGFGLRGQVWWFSQGEILTFLNDGTFSIDSAAPLGLTNASTTAGDQLVFASELRMRVADLEAVQEFAVGPTWTLAVAGGCRYAQIVQTYHHAEAPISQLIDAVTSEHSFSGFGPTIALEARRAFGGSGFSLFSQARASALFGKGKQDAAEIIDNFLATVAGNSRRDVLPVTELEVGGAFGTDWRGVRLSLEAALVGQVWFGTGNAANNELIPVLVDPEVSNNNSNLGLFGFRLGAGITY